VIKDLAKDLIAPHVCCFCGEPIAKKADPEALELAVRHLWSTEKDDPGQALFAHSNCAASRLHSSIPFMPGALIRE
jgi:hypothetical protein